MIDNKADKNLRIIKNIDDNGNCNQVRTEEHRR